MRPRIALRTCKKRLPSERFVVFPGWEWREDLEVKLPSLTRQAGSLPAQ
jgi:hypothetical protein